MVIEDEILKCPIPRVPIPNVAVPDFILQQVKSFSEEKAGQVWLNDWSTKKRVLYSEIIPFIARLTAGMQKRGFRPGNIVCMYASNHVEYPLIVVATWLLKGVITGLSTTSPPNEVAERCDDCEAKIICCDTKRAPRALKAKEMSTNVEEVWVIDGEFEGCVPLIQVQCDTPEIHTESANVHGKHNPDDVIWLPFSSGTTGLPKGIMHTHQTLLSMVTLGSTRTKSDLSRGSFLFINHFAHIAGLSLALSSMAGGTTAITFSELSDDSFLQAIVDTKPYVVMAYSSQMAWLVRHPNIQKYDLGSVEIFSTGGSTWNADDEPAIFSVFPNLKNFSTGYGMTEVGYVSSTFMQTITSGKESQERKRCTSGWLLPGVSLKVLHTTTEEVLGVGQQGAIWVQTPTLMKGYWRNPKANEEFLKDGWAFTGDIGYYDEDEEVFITARIKDLIKYRAAHAVPAKLENMFCSLEGIADACVVGIPHEIDSQHPAAAVVLKPDAKLTAESITDYINQRVADEENLRGGVYFLKQIPYNENGKPVRAQVLKEITTQMKSR